MVGPIVVTGASGFLGMHCVLRLLRDGHSVRGTVRSRERAAEVRETVARHADLGNLSLSAVDLGRDHGWSQVLRGAGGVLHVASPIPRTTKGRNDDLLGPAREGTLRVLRAALEAGINRVVVTSSTTAVLYGHRRDGSRTYDEDDWTRLGPKTGPYERSKTLAERAAWDFVEALSRDRKLELATIQPGVIFGPVLSTDYSVSGEVVRKLLAGEVPGCPDMGWGSVDVRDVADAHVEALFRPEAAGKRFIVALPHSSFVEMASILAKHFNPRGFRVPTRRIPNWALRAAALFDGTTALAIPELGKRQDVSSERARTVLGFRPRSLETTLVDMAESMISLGIVKPKSSRLF